MKRILCIFLTVFASLSLIGEYFVMYYPIRPGDTLFELSQSFGVSISTILDWNGSIDPRSLRVGTILKIPFPDGILYKVSKGESIYDVAKKFFTTIDDIISANDLVSTYVYPGQELFIPTSAVGKGFNDSERFIWPVYGVISSPYGWRIHPIKKVKSFHTGIDIAAPEGAPVFAADSGVVRFAGKNGGYGYFILIDHGGTYSTAYGHLSKIDVYVGQKVSRGQLIGRVGSTGFSTGPHLHFEVRIRGKHTNPLAYLPPRNSMYALKQESSWMGGR